MKVSRPTKIICRTSMRLYYSIWVDCIFKARQSNERTWKLITMILMTTAMSLNFLLLVNLVEVGLIGHPLFRLEFRGLPERARQITEFLLQFVVPWIAINYFLILRKGRYRRLIAKYPNKNGQLFARYFAISIFVPIAVLWIAMFWGRE